MAKKKTKATEQEIVQSAPVKKRTGRNINAWVDDELMNAFESYLNSLEVRPTITRAVELTLKEFLTRRGLWPPRSVVR